MRVLAIFAILFIALCAFYFGIRRLDLSSSTPRSVELCVGGGGWNNYNVSITNQEVCKALVKEIRSASPTFGGSKVVGCLTFRYVDGSSNSVHILPGPSDQYTILKNGTFVVPTNTIFKLLESGGVDVSKIR